MKKYVVTIAGVYHSVTARDRKTAESKALRRARYENKAVKHHDIESVEYLGFYMSGVFVPCGNIVWYRRVSE